MTLEKKSFHSLTPQEQAVHQPQDQKELTIFPYKEHGCWVFDREPITWKELLVFTSLLDKFAKGANKIKLEITTDFASGWDSIQYESDDQTDPQASLYYLNSDPTEDVWLCSWLPWFFGYKPERIWFQVTPLSAN